VIKIFNENRQAFSLRVFLLVAFLWLALIASSLAVVVVTYESRAEFNYLEDLKREQNKLQVILGQYLLEESTWASFNRIEKIASERLQMQVPKAERIIMIKSKVKSNEG
jgi:cell division protein FtsL